MTIDKIITIESGSGPHQILLQRMMRMVPDRDKQDIELKRMLAFRLRTDGESATREYLMRRIRDMIQCAYSGRLYDFLTGQRLTRVPGPNHRLPEPPEIA